jgi:hypothetical protein
MTATPNVTSDTLTRQLLGDLLWLNGLTGNLLGKPVAEMLAAYTTDRTRYYDPAEGDPGLYSLGSSFWPLPPPHRRSAIRS